MGRKVDRYIYRFAASYTSFTAISSGTETDGCAVAASEELSKQYDFVVGADGVRSVVRQALEERSGASTKTVRFEDRNERRYKTIPLHPEVSYKSGEGCPVRLRDSTSSFL